MYWAVRAARSMSKLVPVEGTAEYKRWQVPDVSSGAGGGADRGQNKYITAVQLEKIQKQAYEEAYARGLREGTAAGQAHVKEQARRFVSLANLLEKPLQHAGESIEQDILLLCLAITKQIIRREITLDSGHIVAVIREAVSALPMSSHKIQIRLHPEDAEVLRSVLAESKEDVSWKVIEDPALARGDCRVFTENSQVDATLEKRLAIIASKLMGGEREHDHRK